VLAFIKSFIYAREREVLGVLYERL